MSRARRDLTEDELALWRHVIRDVAPYANNRPARPPLSPAARHPTPETPALPPAERHAAPRPLVLAATDGIDRRTARRFARGEMTIDARLDLHGLTLREAHAAVDRFVRRCADEGRRLVLIVTGKGAHRQGGGRIRGEALHWLDHAALRPLILAIHEAGVRHGGAGAFYVLLRRQRAG
jgi:DNA-nicking Smr family endonuclease